MRQTHVGGDKLFVDYAGDTVPVIVDRLTGETRQAQIFVAVLGASNFTYAEATVAAKEDCSSVVVNLPQIFAAMSASGCPFSPTFD
jgi:transposase